MKKSFVKEKGEMGDSPFTLSPASSSTPVKEPLRQSDSQAVESTKSHPKPPPGVKTRSDRLAKTRAQNRIKSLWAIVSKQKGLLFNGVAVVQNVQD